MQKDLPHLRIELLNGSYLTGRKMNIEKKGRTAATVNPSMSDLKTIFAFAQSNGYKRGEPDDGHQASKKIQQTAGPAHRRRVSTAHRRVLYPAEREHVIARDPDRNT